MQIFQIILSNIVFIYIYLYICIQVKAYPHSLKLSIENGEPLHSNRRGIVSLHSTSEKPTVTPSELVQMRRLGLSYKQIGKKLGVDPHKEEVLQVYESITESTGIDIETVKAPNKVSPSSALWYTFRSERDVIANSIIPTKEDVLSLFPQHRIKQRLGEHAGFLLAAFRDVQKVIHEETLNSLKGASPKSHVGQMKNWIEDLPLSVCQKVFDIEEAVAEEAFELTEYWEDSIGRCKCSSIKVIRFGWKTVPIPHPSFFWGCSNYTPVDKYSHDKGIPLKQSCWEILNPGSDNRGKSSHISDLELERLATKFVLIDEFWSDQQAGSETNESLISSASKLYGAKKEDLPLCDIESVQNVVTVLREGLKFLKDERIAAVIRE